MQQRVTHPFLPQIFNFFHRTSTKVKPKLESVASPETIPATRLLSETHEVLFNNGNARVSVPLAGGFVIHIDPPQATQSACRADLLKTMNRLGVSADELSSQ